ncbi:MAG: hypothetical protein EPN97_14670 [Alphaproteobacteria bacterium]|nr:MAG: hypothetical protein EPN97_14670 [Alphaproteobacteria bacterium]
MQAKKKTKNRAANRERLAALRKTLAADPEGKRLLDLARKQRVPISFSADPKKMDALGLFDIVDRTVTLNPGEDDRALSGVLAHELRHLWQAGVADVREKEISATDMLVRRRLIESDAFAYEMRFHLSAQLRTMEKLSKIAARHAASPDGRAAKKMADEARAAFGMKAYFMKAQKKRMGVYDKTTLRSLALQLKLAQIYAEQKKLLDAHPSKSKKLAAARRECDQGLKNIFNRVSAPQPLDDSLVNITREGLSRRSPNYLGFTTAKELSAFIRRQIPAGTVKKARALEKKIKKTAGRALGRK